MKIRVSVLGGLLLFVGLLGSTPWRATAQAGGAPAGTPTLVQDFQDVPTSSPFYTYVHNLFVDGVVGGYSCGGPNEPCVPPANLPYFRPGANVTRGQNAKFTDNGRRVLSGAHTGTSPDFGLFSALNTDESSSFNAGLYGQGATGVWGASQTTGTADGYGGYFSNSGGGTGRQLGVFAGASSGWGVLGESSGATSSQGSAGVVGQSTGADGVGGVFTATNGVRSAGLVASGGGEGVFGTGATGVAGVSVSTGAAAGYGGYFFNGGGGTGSQFGVYATSNGGWGVQGVSNGATSSQGSAGVVGQSFGPGGAGGVFTATQDVRSAGLVAAGQTGAVIAGRGVAVAATGDALDIGGLGYAIYSTQPSGDIYYTLYGLAHIHGSNVASADYESEVVYDGATPLALGSVVALDPANAMGGALGVLPAEAAQPDAAIGVVSYRLTTVPVNGVAKPMIDAQATAVQPGDRAYITILGRVAMVLPAGARVGARLAVGAAGAAVLAASGDPSFGRVASRPDATGRGYVLVNFK